MAGDELSIYDAPDETPRTVGETGPAAVAGSGACLFRLDFAVRRLHRRSAAAAAGSDRSTGAPALALPLLSPNRPALPRLRTDPLLCLRRTRALGRSTALASAWPVNLRRFPAALAPLQLVLAARHHASAANTAHSQPPRLFRLWDRSAHGDRSHCLADGPSPAVLIGIYTAVSPSPK